MTIKTILIASALATATALTSGCASSQREDVYRRDQARSSQVVERGVVQSVRGVQIEGTKSGIGSAAGGIAGGIAGSGVGDGRGAGVASVIGAVIGGIAGAATEEVATRKDGVEIIVDLDDGRSLAIVQEYQDETQFRPGDRVRVISGRFGEARVTK